MIANRILYEICNIHIMKISWLIINASVIIIIMKNNEMYVLTMNLLDFVIHNLKIFILFLFLFIG